MTIKEQILDFLRTQKMSTEEVSDALGKTGCIEGLYPVNNGHYAVGEVQYVYAHNNSNYSIHEQIRDIEAGKILYVDALNVGNYAIFGELVSMYIIEKRGVPAILINGKARDLSGLRQRGYSVWCKGITPIGCFNVKVEESEDIVSTSTQNRLLLDGSIAVCDDSGVVVIPKSDINSNLLEHLQNMKKQEKIWFDCVENRGWNTYDTVCLKKYNNE